MTHEDPVVLEKHGITTEQKTVYLYKGYRYDHAKDALNYAKIEEEKGKSPTKK